MSMHICWRPPRLPPKRLSGHATNGCSLRPKPCRSPPKFVSSTMSSLDGEIRVNRHHMQIRVYYEDTDFSGIVYHANYLRFMERGRTNHLRLMGADQHALFAEAQAETPGFAFVVRSMEIHFLRPARMDDLLDVVTWPVAVKGASITLAQEVRRGDEALVNAKVRVAFICEGRAKPIPKSLRLLMKADLE